MSVPEACSEVHMDKYMMLCIAFAVIALALSVCIYVQKSSTSRYFNRLDQMLEAAMDGSFEEQHFDESRFSSFEARLGRYLSRQAGKERELSKTVRRTASGAGAGGIRRAGPTNQLPGRKASISHRLSYQRSPSGAGHHTAVPRDALCQGAYGSALQKKGPARRRKREYGLNGR